MHNADCEMLTRVVIVAVLMIVNPELSFVQARLLQGLYGSDCQNEQEMSDVSKECSSSSVASSIHQL